VSQAGAARYEAGLKSMEPPASQEAAPERNQGRGRFQGAIQAISSDLDDDWEIQPSAKLRGGRALRHGPYGGNNPGPHPAYGWDDLPAPRLSNSQPRAMAAQAAEGRARDAERRGIVQKPDAAAVVPRVSDDARVAEGTAKSRTPAKTGGGGTVPAPRRSAFLYQDETKRWVKEYAQKHFSNRAYATRTEVSDLLKGIDSEYIRFLTNQNPGKRLSANHPPGPWNNERTFTELPESALEGRDSHWISFVVRTDGQSKYSKIAPLTPEETALIKSHLPLRMACLNVAKKWLSHWGLAIIDFENSHFEIVDIPTFKARLGNPDDHNKRRMTRLLRFMHIFFENTAEDLLAFLFAHVRNGPLHQAMLDVEEHTILCWYTAVHD
jgi:hypothetical protein